MKECNRCRYCGRECYEYSETACDLFGENIPEWADNRNDGCLLKSQEVKKAIKLANNFLLVGTGKLSEYGYPEFTEEDKKHNALADKRYKEYIEVLKKRCVERSK